MARRGTSLVELLVALLLLQVVGTAALASAFLATRLAARAQRGIATDRLRRETLDGIAAAPACRDAAPPMTLAITLPATPERPALAVRLRCGGVALMELLVTITLLGLVGILAVAMLRGTTRPLVRITAAAEAGRTIDALVMLAGVEQATPTGLRAHAEDAAVLRLARYVGDAPACAASGVQLALSLDRWIGERLPDASRDALAVLDSVGEWHHATPATVASGACPDGTPALWFTLDGPMPTGWIVVQEPSRVRAYNGVGGQWLGLVGVRAMTPIQPFAGPLEGDGLSLVATASGVTAVVRPVGRPAHALRLATTAP